MLAAAGGYLVGSRRTIVVEAARDQRQALLQADRDFDDATAKGGSAAWASYFTDDGLMMPAGGDMIVGRDKIQKAMSEVFSSPGYSLRWEPMDAASSGNLGYTYGVFKTTRTGADGKPFTSYGKYVTIWRNERGAGWKIAVDIGNASPTPQNTSPAPPKEP